MLIGWLLLELHLHICIDPEVKKDFVGGHINGITIQLASKYIHNLIVQPPTTTKVNAKHVYNSKIILMLKYTI